MIKIITKWQNERRLLKQDIEIKTKEVKSLLDTFKRLNEEGEALFTEGRNKYYKGIELSAAGRDLCEEANKSLFKAYAIQDQADKLVTELMNMTAEHDHFFKKKIQKFLGVNERLLKGEANAS